MNDDEIEKAYERAIERAESLGDNDYANQMAQELEYYRKYLKIETWETE